MLTYRQSNFSHGIAKNFASRHIILPEMIIINLKAKGYKVEVEFMTIRIPPENFLAKHLRYFDMCR
jgi:hypothetical protein